MVGVSVSSSLFTRGLLFSTLCVLLSSVVMVDAVTQKHARVGIQLDAAATRSAADVLAPPSSPSPSSPPLQTTRDFTREILISSVGNDPSDEERKRELMELLTARQEPFAFASLTDNKNNNTGTSTAAAAAAGNTTRTEREVDVDRPEFFPPYPTNLSNEVNFTRYVKTHENPLDTTRLGVGKGGRFESFPIPYDLFALFDQDRSGELNYKEFMKLLDYVNNDYVLPKDRKRANYKIIIETINGTEHFPDLPVYVTFLGPTGQSSTEKLLKKGFSAGYDAIVLNAEDVSFVTNVRLHLGRELPNNASWNISKIVVEVHGRIMESKVSPIHIRHALHIPLKPTDLRLNDSLKEQALGGVEDTWTRHHYDVYEQHVAAFKLWLDKHMDEQRHHNVEASKNLTALLNNATARGVNGTNHTVLANVTHNATVNASTGSNTTTTVTPAPKASVSGTVAAVTSNKGAASSKPNELAANVAGGIASEGKRVPIKLADDQAAGQSKKQKKNKRKQQKPRPEADGLESDIEKSAESPELVKAFLAQKREQEQRAEERAILAAAGVLDQSVMKPKRVDLLSLPSRELPPIDIPAIKAFKPEPQSAVEARKAHQLALQHLAAAAGNTLPAGPEVTYNGDTNPATPIRGSASSPTSPLPNDRKFDKTPQNPELKKKYDEYLAKQRATQKSEEQKQLDQMLHHLANVKSQQMIASINSARVQAAAELRDLKMNGLPEPTLQQKLASIKVDMDSYLKRPAPVKEQTVAKDGVTVPPTHKRNNSMAHMMLEHTPAASWGGSDPLDYTSQFDNYELDVGIGTGPLSDWNYVHHGEDWEGRCHVGRKQSPVFIRTTLARPTSGLREPGDTKMVLRYKKVSPKHHLRIKHTGHALMVNTEELAGYLSSGLNNDSYLVKELVFHAPSEHAFDYSKRADNLFDMELQIIHQKNNSIRADDVLIISILFELSPKDNPFLDQFEWHHLPHVAGKSRFLTSTLNLAQAADWDSPVFSYIGSLTTPPCSENVQWRVLKKIVPISRQQLKRINRLFSANPGFAAGSGNNRRVQPFYNREGGLAISY